MSKKKQKEKKKETKVQIMQYFDKVFDDYNDKKMTKKRMLENCVILYKKFKVVLT